MTLIEPLLSDDALAADIEAADPGEGIVLWWLGQSGFLVKSAAGRVLFDPYLSDSLTRKYEHSDKPHKRMTRRAISPSELKSINIVTSSHSHTDHLDAETLAAVLVSNPEARLIIPEANRVFVADRLGCNLNWPLGMSDGELLAVDGFEFHAVPAAHNNIDRDERGRCQYLGYVVRFGQITVYHSGDTLRYAHMADLLRQFPVDVALLPINGNRPERRVAGNLLGDEAARLAYDIGAQLVVPCHYDMFVFNTESPDLFVKTCLSVNQPFRVLQCGERLSIEPRSAK